MLNQRRRCDFVHCSFSIRWIENSALHAARRPVAFQIPATRNIRLEMHQSRKQPLIPDTNHSAARRRIELPSMHHMPSLGSARVRLPAVADGQAAAGCLSAALDAVCSAYPARFTAPVKHDTQVSAIRQRAVQGTFISACRQREDDEPCRVGRRAYGRVASRTCLRDPSRVGRGARMCVRTKSCVIDGRNCAPTTGVVAA